MYKKHDKQALMGNLPLFLDGTLNSNNRWVVLASLIPWYAVDDLYSKNFISNKGPKALSSRIALGALIIQIKLNLSDSETVQQITENPYLQYFIGFDQFSQEEPFDSSMMTYFRKRLNLSDIKEIDSLLHKLKHNNTERKEIPSDDDDKPQNKGKLIVDATCAPADVHYPTDLGLLNKARKKTEMMIDILWKTRTNKGHKIKPKTYP